MSMSTSTYTFWKLIKEYEIEIPIIQRDYAHGRMDEQSKDIRKHLIRNIKSVLQSNEQLHLNFVYGEIKNNAFIPLDGQQRLTTLYLLHWYLTSCLELQNEKESLLRFSYDIRPSSKDFCGKLVKAKIKPDPNLAISAVVKDKSWFFDYWLKDSTVRGMLNMLDAIHEEFKSENEDLLRGYWDSLVGGEGKITFDFFNLKELKLSDELYVKMNARGKQLTPFENFKAWLIAYVEKSEMEIADGSSSPDWRTKIDTEWADLFWSNKDESNYLIDEEYMRFFRNMAQLYYLKNTKYILEDQLNEVDAEKERKNASLLATTKGTNGEYLFISNDQFSELGIFTKKNLNECFSILDIFKKNNAVLAKASKKIPLNKEYKTAFKIFITGNMSYRDKLFFYGVVSWFLSNPDSESEEMILQWVRVLRNLTVNTTIDRLASYLKTLDSLDRLLAHSGGIIDFLNRQDIDSKLGFDPFQMKEEIRKAKLIKKNAKWEGLLLKYENHEYFKGQINFLLDLSAVNGIVNMEKFEIYAEKCSTIFNSKLKYEDDVTLERALLTKGDYLIHVRSNRSFVSMSSSGKRGGNQDWRTTIFRDSYKLKLLKSVLDQIQVDSEQEGLEKLINDSHIDEEIPTWRALLIKYPQAITYCKKRYIRYVSEDNIKLLGSSGLHLKHVELYSFAVSQQIDRASIEPFKDIEYYPAKGGSKKGVANMDKFIRSDNHYALDIRYFYQGNYQLRFFNRNSSEIEADIRNYFLSIGFEVADASEYNNNSIVKYYLYPDLIQGVKDICLALEKINNKK